MGAWHKSITDGSLVGAEKMTEQMRSMYQSEAKLRETEEMLAPLIRQVEKEMVDPEILEHLDQMVTKAAEREYKDAATTYAQLTVGKKKWNNAVMFGEAKHNKGFNSRRVKRDVGNKFDSDEAVQKYVQAFRRIMTFAQAFRPNS